MKNVFLTAGLLLGTGTLILLQVKAWHLIVDAQAPFQQFLMWAVIGSTNTTFLAIGLRSVWGREK
ncbi:hypothetical protein WL81_02265 [Burkholderia ubonensis]|uniref:Uncharacterized protein n=1 Tax=Burkholderia pseudomultivorans TaxID=1207504 RepID=A0A132EM50_9BURK|nr:hypothetical protein WL81_02265 [Burkholderia ubonensis]KWF37436.1 hypothetical protein WT56_34415 [Burkholderia pseudomultivorans]